MPNISRATLVAVACMMLAGGFMPVTASAAVTIPAPVADDIEAASTKGKCIVGPTPGVPCSAGRFKNAHAFRSFNGWSPAGSESFVGEVRTQLHYDNGRVFTRTCTVVATIGYIVQAPVGCSSHSSGPSTYPVDGYHTHSCVILTGAGRLTCWVEYYY